MEVFPKMMSLLFLLSLQSLSWPAHGFRDLLSVDDFQISVSSIFVFLVLPTCLSSCLLGTPTSPARN